MQETVKITSTSSSTDMLIDLVRINQRCIDVDIKWDQKPEEMPIYAVKLQKLVNKARVCARLNGRDCYLNRGFSTKSPVQNSEDCWIDCTADGMPGSSEYTVGDPIIQIDENKSRFVKHAISNSALYIDMGSEKKLNFSVIVKTGQRAQKLDKCFVFRIVVYNVTSTNTHMVGSLVFGCINHGKNKKAEDLYNAQLPLLFNYYKTSSQTLASILNALRNHWTYVHVPTMDSIRKFVLWQGNPSNIDFADRRNHKAHHQGQLTKIPTRPVFVIIDEPPQSIVTNCRTEEQVPKKFLLSSIMDTSE